MSSPLVSILVPVYNAAAYITDCLDSLVSQSYTNIEVLCVNDGSTDNSLDILYTRSEQDSRIKVFDKVNGGASSARNVGLAAAQGEYICMVDSDDYIDGEAIAKLVSSVQSNMADAVLFDLHYIYDDLRQIKFKNVPTKGCITGLRALELSLDWSISGIGMFSKDVFANVCYDESNLHGDELTTRVLFSKCEVVTFSTGKYYYRQHTQSSTSSFSMSRFGLLDNQLKIKELLETLGCFKVFKSRYCSQLLVSIWSVMIVYEENKEILGAKETEFVRQRIIFFQQLARKTFSISLFLHNTMFFKAISLISLSYSTLKVGAKLFIFCKKIKGII